MHAQGDLAAIGDEDLVEHRYSITTSGFAIFDRLAILDEDLGHLAGPRRGDLVHRLHGLDDEQRLACLHFGADLDEIAERPACGAR